MRYGSLCSGIEAASVAWGPLGWEPVWFSEIAAFPSAVLDYHYPETINHGDFTTISKEKGGTIDLLVGGTPCQSFSVAGNRAGLDDPRGNLALEFLALARRLRPKWLVWENVPGVLSAWSDEASTEGIDDPRIFVQSNDFDTFSAFVAECGYGYAWRILDAQYFGVPQRRRRVFLIGYLGDWRPPVAVLLERESMSGYPPPSREARPRTATDLERCAREDGRRIDEREGACATVFGGNDTRGPLDVAPACNASPGGRLDFESEALLTVNTRQDPIVGALAPPLGSESGEAVCFDESLSYALLNPGEGGRSHNRITPDSAMRVRRFTPRECERLQGFPDDYTAVPWRGKPANQCPDSPRYSALGNSMAVVVMAWLGRRIQAVRDILESVGGPNG